MDNITISKKEYSKLKLKAKAYEKLAGEVFKNVLKDPVKEVVDDFRKTGLYSDEFLIDLENGLRKSSYTKKRK